MSEPTFPFEGATAVATAPPAQPDVVAEEPAGRDRSTLLVAGGAAVVLVLGVVGYFLFFAGGSPDPATPAPASHPVAPAAPAPADAGTTVKSPKIKVKNFGRDPFKALIVEAPTDATAGGSTTTGTTTPATTTDSTTTPATTDGSSTTGGVTTPVASKAHSFRVVEVAPDNSAVSVKVDGTVYRNLKAGEVFATYFKVLIISGTTNAFQYGEEKFNVLGTKRLTIA